MQAILSGEYSTKAKAYQSVYIDSIDDSARSNIAPLLAITCNSALYEALKEQQLLAGTITRSEAMKILSDMASTSPLESDISGTFRRCKILRIPDLRVHLTRTNRTLFGAIKPFVARARMLSINKVSPWSRQTQHFSVAPKA